MRPVPKDYDQYIMGIRNTQEHEDKMEIDEIVQPGDHPTASQVSPPLTLQFQNMALLQHEPVPPRMGESFHRRDSDVGFYGRHYASSQSFPLPAFPQNERYLKTPCPPDPLSNYPPYRHVGPYFRKSEDREHVYHDNVARNSYRRPSTDHRFLASPPYYTPRRASSPTLSIAHSNPRDRPLSSYPYSHRPNLGRQSSPDDHYLSSHYKRTKPYGDVPFDSGNPNDSRRESVSQDQEHFPLARRPSEMSHDSGKSTNGYQDSPLPSMKSLLSSIPVDTVVPVNPRSDPFMDPPVDSTNSLPESLVKLNPILNTESLSSRQSFLREETQGSTTQPLQPASNQLNGPIEGRHVSSSIAALERIKASQTPIPKSPETVSIGGPSIFPTSAVRSTASPGSKSKGIRVPMYPGPSLVVLEPPRQVTHPHLNPDLQQLTSRPRVEQTNPEPEHETDPPRPKRDREPKISEALKTKLILLSVQKEEAPNSLNPPTYPCAKSPSPHILGLQLPQLVDTTHPSKYSARALLVPPPTRNDPDLRSEGKDIAFASWLFISSTNVQRCLLRAASLGSRDLLRAADELMVTTQWIVTYLHQTGPSFALRRTMRIAFWEGVSLAWFIIVQYSCMEAMKPIDEAKIQPFPDNQAIQTLESEVDPMRKSLEPPTQGLPDKGTVSRPMKGVVIQSKPSTGSVKIPERLIECWKIAKRLNKKPKYPSHLGEKQWLEIREILVEFSHELRRYGLMDMGEGLRVNEIMHRIDEAIKDWRQHDLEVSRIADAKFKKLKADERKFMLLAIRDDMRMADKKK